jgi:hypothetical protein
MEALLTYRGKGITQEDVVFIRDLIVQNPGDSRWSLSRKLCQAWNWRQANGALRDMICRGLMLALERAGYIELPAKKRNPLNPLVTREKPSPVVIDPQPIEGSLSSILPLEICQVRRTPLEKLCNSLIEQYHYLGYCQPVGEHLKYLVFAGQRPVACMIYSSAPRHIGCRDRFIGPGCGCLILPPIFWDGWRRNYPRTGSDTISTRSTSRRPLWTWSGSKGPVTKRPTGSIWVRPPDGGKTITPISLIDPSRRSGGTRYAGILKNSSVRSAVKKRMKKDNLVNREELLALLERVEARSLKEGDGQLIKAVIEKTFRVRQLHWEGKITSKGQLRRLLEIQRPDKSDDSQ